MATESSKTAVQKLYLAYYGRPADPSGLEFWAGRLDSQGGALNGILDSFATSAEATKNFAGKSNQDLIRSVYQVLFNRNLTESDPGLKFYSDSLSKGERTLQSIALDILNGASGSDLTLIQNKTEVAKQFTDALDTALEKGSYAGDTAVLRARTLISKVTMDLTASKSVVPGIGDLSNLLKGDTNTASQVLTLVDTLLKNLPTAGSAPTSIPPTSIITVAKPVPLPEATAAPTVAPTSAPTVAPTLAPTAAPTAAPTSAPTAAPTSAPTAAPTEAPTAAPTPAPTEAPTPAPTKAPVPETTNTSSVVGEAQGADLPGSTSTSGVIKTDGTDVTGFFDRTSRQDWYGMEVEAGKVYKLTLDAANAGRDSIQVIQNNFIQNLVKLSADGESIYFNSDRAGTVHFAVKGNTAIEGQGYTISAEVVSSLDDTGYQIEFDLASQLLPFKSYFDMAAQAISDIVVGDLPSVASAYKDGFVDDLYIKVMVDSSITGTLLGYAGPEDLRDGSKLPSAADMYTTPAVLSRLGQAQSVDFIVHETLHAMGLGTLWNNFKLLNLSGNYIGANALDAYRELTGKLGLTSVPVDAGSGHFSESALGNEILTPTIGRNSFISVVSIGALEDLGYVVDYTEAESFVLPTGIFTG